MSGAPPSHEATIEEEATINYPTRPVSLPSGPLTRPRMSEVI